MPPLPRPIVTSTTSPGSPTLMTARSVLASGTVPWREAMLQSSGISTSAGPTTSGPAAAGATPAINAKTTNSDQRVDTCRTLQRPARAIEAGSGSGETAGPSGRGRERRAEDAAAHGLDRQVGGGGDAVEDL